MSFFQKLRADAYLGYRAIIAHPLKRLFKRSDVSGRDQFLSNFAPEGLIPTSEADRRVLLLASRCIQCGLCDQDASITEVPGPSWLPLIWSRSVPALRDLRRSFQRFDPSGLKLGESVCPTRVPLRTLYEYSRTKIAELERP